MRVELTYMVPLVVTVDTSTEEVLSVVQQVGDILGPSDAYRVGFGLLTPENRQLAEKIAEEKDWPAWDGEL